MTARKEITISRRAMACDFSLTFPASERRAVEAGCQALDEVERLEAKLSVYLDDSDLSRLNRRAPEAPAVVDDELFSLMTLSARLSAVTGGVFDPAGGALIRAWGFFRPPRRVPSDAELRQALSASGMRNVAIDAGCRSVRYIVPGLEVNFGAIGKGFAIDRALDSIRSRSVLMQGGQSSLRAAGDWRIAIGDPWRPARTLAIVRLRDRALGTSAAANQHFFEGGRRWGHILDPRTGWPAAQLASASAVAPTAAEADALSTAFFVMGVEGTRDYCRQHPEVGAVLLSNPGTDRPAQIVVLGSAEVEMPK